MSQRRPTQADVARLAGVSQAMVSYVLNDRKTVQISDETRRRVLAAVEELGYVPNKTARSLRTTRSYTIASIIPDITNPFYPALQRGIQDVVEREGYDLIIYNSDGRRDREEKCLRSLQQAGVDGAIVVLFSLTARALFPLLEANTPVVRLEPAPKAPGPYPLDNLYVDNAAAAATAVGFLLKNGYRRVSMLAGDQGPGDARVQGYRRAHQLHGMSVEEALIHYGAFTEEGGHRGMADLLRLGERPDAVFAANDLLAMGAMIAITEAGLRVPGDVGVVGFDDIPTAKLVTPALTTVNQFQKQMGRRAAEMLFDRILREAPMPGRSEEHPYELVIRASA